MKSKKHIFIIGLGKTGLSCVHYFHERNMVVSVVDTRDNPPGLQMLQDHYPEVEIVLGELDDDMLVPADMLVVSPGISLKTPAIANCIQRGVEVVGDVELFARVAKAPILAITGSNGKTTVTSLLGEVMREAGKQVEVCGNIGEPVLATLQKPVPDFYVMECSSFQLETTQHLCAKVAVVLNVSPDHMDRYADEAEYLAAKQSIYRDCQIAVVNTDESEIWQHLSLTQPIIKFSLHHLDDNTFGVCEYQGKTYLAHGKKRLLPVDELTLNAEHHWQNALATLAMGYAVGLPYEPMLTVLKRFSGLAHRCQWVAKRGEVDWYNDSKATNVGAAVAAIQSLGKNVKGNLLLIAGGDAKGADFAELKPLIAKYVGHMILLGRDAPKLHAAFSDVVTITHVETLPAAVKEAAVIAQRGDTVLLSPACASLDMFDNFMQRGEVFMQSVEALPQ